MKVEYLICAVDGYGGTEYHDSEQEAIEAAQRFSWGEDVIGIWRGRRSELENDGGELIALVHFSKVFRPETTLQAAAREEG